MISLTWNILFTFPSKIFFKVRFVKHKEKNKKQMKKNNINTQEQILYFNYEDEYFIKSSFVEFSYKIPFEKKKLEYLENEEEPQYKSICLIEYKKFIEVVEYLKSSG